MAQRAESQVVVLVFCIGVLVSAWTALLLFPLPADVPESSGQWLQIVGPSYPHGRAGWHYCLLALARASPSCCGHVGSEPMK